MRTIVYLLIFSAQFLYAGQYEWLITSQYTKGFETRDIKLWNSNVQNLQSNGALVSTNIQYQWLSKLKTYGGIGTRAYSLSGNTEQLKFSGNVFKIFFSIGGKYEIIKNHSFDLGILAENNAELDNFSFLNSDLVRYAFRLQYQYNLNESFALTTGLTTAMYPLVDVYLIENPSKYFSIGINYKLF